MSVKRRSTAAFMLSTWRDQRERSGRVAKVSYQKGEQAQA